MDKKKKPINALGHLIGSLKLYLISKEKVLHIFFLLLSLKIIYDYH